MLIPWIWLYRTQSNQQLALMSCMTKLLRLCQSLKGVQVQKISLEMHSAKLGAKLSSSSCSMFHIAGTLFIKCLIGSFSSSQLLFCFCQKKKKGLNLQMRNGVRWRVWWHCWNRSMMSPLSFVLKSTQRFQRSFLWQRSSGPSIQEENRKTRQPWTWRNVYFQASQLDLSMWNLHMHFPWPLCWILVTKEKVLSGLKKLQEQFNFWKRQPSLKTKNILRGLVNVHHHWHHKQKG